MSRTTERRRQTADIETSRAVAKPKKRRSVFDAWHSRVLPGHLVMDELVVEILRLRNGFASRSA